MCTKNTIIITHILSATLMTTKITTMGILFIVLNKPGLETSPCSNLETGLNQSCLMLRFLDDFKFQFVNTYKSTKYQNLTVVKFKRTKPLKNNWSWGCNYTSLNKKLFFVQIPHFHEM
jgi:hypothetical protein